MLKKANLTIWLSAIPLWILVNYAKENPSTTERFYSQLIYPWIFKIHKLFFGQFPFSVGDVLYLLFFLYLIRQGVKKWKYWRVHLWSFISDLGTGVVIIFWLFHLSWGFNYHRQPLSKQLGISTGYNEVELTERLNQLIINANQLHRELVGTDSLPVQPPESKAYFLNSSTVYHPVNKGEAIDLSRVKKSFFSLPLSYMGYAGYLNPFTLESQVNSKMPTLNLATTLLHESAHQMGYASEKEANFIAYLSAIKNDDPYVQYAGYTFAVRYFYAELYRANKSKAEEMAKMINRGILKNFKEASDFWKRYENPFEVLFDKTYDTYLKANGESSGIKSYNEMVGLVINYHKQSEGF